MPPRQTRANSPVSDTPADPAAITRLHIQGILRADRDAGRTPRTINIRLSTLRTFYRYLSEQQLVAAEEVPTNTVRKMREGRKLPRALSDADVRLLLAACDRETFSGLRDYVMILLLIDTGMRRKEICLIRHADLDIQDRSIHLCHELKGVRLF